MNNDINKINDKNYIPLTPFKGWVIENFPFIEADFDAITNYELICQVTKYLNEVISNQNQVEELGSELVQGYNNLVDFVNNYFENLDVQTEINLKLDEMAENGSLTNLIKGYIDPIYQAYENEINTSLSNYQMNINNQVSNINAKVNAAVDNNPIPVSNVSDMTDTTKIYVLTTNGYWYYYDGDSWEQGGIYQSSVSTSDMENKINKQLKNIFDITGITPLTTLNNAGGTQSSTTLATSDYMFLKQGDTAYFATPVMRYALYDTSKVYISDSYQNNSTFPGFKGTTITATNDCYLRISVLNNWNKECMVILNKPADEEITEFIPFEYYIENDIHSSKTLNDDIELMLIKKYGYDGNVINLTFTDDIFKNGHTAGTTSSSNADMAYFNVTKDEIYHIHGYNYKGIPMYVLTDGVNDADNISYPLIPDTPLPLSENDIFFKIPFTGTLYVHKILTYGITVEKVTNLKLKQQFLDLTGFDSNVLNNKKYVAFGDSFTHGDFTNAPEDDYHIIGGLYDGQYKVYPYLIGNRNNMIIQNKAVNGMTLARKTGSTNSIMVQEDYKNLDADTDYITIKIGINDDSAHQNIPIGTIDSTDDTTFYGAYNILMSYLIEHYPNAKIGIIVTNGSKLDIVNATLAIATKYGIPVLNEATDPNVPLLIRTNRTDVSDTIKDIRNNNWFVSTTIGSLNSHPNAKCHEYESTIVEDYLRRL